MHLHAVEARAVRRADGLPEIAGYLPDFIVAHTSYGGVGIEVEARRSADGNLSGGGRVGHVAAMPDLNRGGCALLVNGVGDRCELRDDRLAEPKLLSEGESAAADGGVSQRGHADASACDADVVLFELFGGAEIPAHRFKGRRADRAVAQGYAAQSVRGEKLRLLVQKVLRFHGVSR